MSNKNKVVLELKPKQVEKLIDKLPVEEKIRLVRKLEKETWAKRLDEVILRVRKKLRKNPLSDKEITQICKETRQRFYNEKAKSSN